MYRMIKNSVFPSHLTLAQAHELLAGLRTPCFGALQTNAWKYVCKCVCVICVCTYGCRHMSWSQNTKARYRAMCVICVYMCLSDTCVNVGIYVCKCGYIRVQAYELVSKHQGALQTNRYWVDLMSGLQASSQKSGYSRSLLPL
jgi:hypothetical protein